MEFGSCIAGVDIWGRVGACSSIGESGGGGILVPFVRDSKVPRTGSSKRVEEVVVVVFDDGGMADLGCNGALTLRLRRCTKSLNPLREDVTRKVSFRPVRVGVRRVSFMTALELAYQLIEWLPQLE